MNFETLINRLVEGKEDKGDYLLCAKEIDIEVSDLFNRVSIYFAQKFMSDEMSFENADFAVNGVWSAMLDYILIGDRQLIEPCYSIYQAFDEGEYDHRDGTDPIEMHTKPLLEKVLSNA